MQADTRRLDNYSKTPQEVKKDVVWDFLWGQNVEIMSLL